MTPLAVAYARLLVAEVPARVPLDDVDKTRLDDLDIPAFAMGKGREFEVATIGAFA